MGRRTHKENNTLTPETMESRAGQTGKSWKPSQTKHKGEQFQASSDWPVIHHAASFQKLHREI